MAGDIGVREQIIIQDGGKEAAGAIHRYGPRVVIRIAAEDGETDVEERAVAELDSTGAIGLAAFRLRRSDDFIAAKARRPHDGARWDGGGNLLPPDPPPEHGSLTLREEITFGRTSERMTGSIAVGLVVVSGPTPELQFSNAELVKVVAEVQNGLAWHAAQNPLGGITWVYDFHHVQVPAVPGSGPDREALWRDPAMARLGFSGSWNGVTEYLDRIRALYGTQWGFVGYFTKYPLDWFAYANLGGPRLVMQYGNDGWGPDNIDRVFAHEVGHIFQAPDEYADSSCNCGESWGIYNQPNANCSLCAPGGGAACIMGSNAWAYCLWTPLHYGIPIITGALGTTTVADRQLHVFAEVNDNNVWMHSWNGTAWQWSNRQAPRGIIITDMVGATTVDDARPYCFARGHDRTLWMNWWDGTNWRWSSQGGPSGVDIERGMGVTSVDGSHAHAFVEGSDGNIWVNWWDGSAWKWSEVGRPRAGFAAPLGAISIGGLAQCLALDRDGKLQIATWTGLSATWDDHGSPTFRIADPFGVILADGRPYVFVRDRFAMLWVRTRSGSTWSWVNLGTPPMTTVAAPMGAVAAGRRPNCFVRGLDGNLWVSQWNGTAWNWSNLGRPAGVDLVISMGAEAIDGGRPYCFVRGSDGNLWVCWWNGSAWSWSNQIRA
ncbi:MAG TPA: hypothetical protein VF006_06740 [Longimicrobium sp.]